MNKKEILKLMQDFEDENFMPIDDILDYLAGMMERNEVTPYEVLHLTTLVHILFLVNKLVAKVSDDTN